MISSRFSVDHSLQDKTNKKPTLRQLVYHVCLSLPVVAISRNGRGLKIYNTDTGDTEAEIPIPGSDPEITMDSIMVIIS